MATQAEIQWNNLYAQKDGLRKTFLQLRNKAIVGYFKQMTNQNFSVKKLHRDLVNSISEPKYQKVAFNLIKYIDKKLNKLKKKKDEDTGAFLDLVFTSVLYGSENLNAKTKSIINQNVIVYEGQLKQRYIKEQVEKARNLKQIFYLCSEHGDCAKDHLDYQGKVYVDENWSSLDLTPEQKIEIEKYIKLNNIMSFQGICGKPVWLFTRPNCRHFFKRLSFEDVANKGLGTAYANNMYFETGNKTIQTIYHNTQRYWYTEENINGIIKQYQERLTLNKEIYKVHKSEIVYRAIRKDNFLIQKWTNYKKMLYNEK